MTNERIFTLPLRIGVATSSSPFQNLSHGNEAVAAPFELGAALRYTLDRTWANLALATPRWSAERDRIATAPARAAQVQN